MGEVRSVETTLKGTKLSLLRTPLGVLPKGLLMSVVALRRATPRMAIVKIVSGRLRRVFVPSPFPLAAVRLVVVLAKPRADFLSRVR